MSLATQRRGQLGVNVVERIVLRDWGSRWQSIDGANDDGIDGLIFIEKGGMITGEIVHVQVKCRNAKKDAAGIWKMSIGRDDPKKKAERWRRIVGAAIMININPDTLEAFWVDLRNGNPIVGKQFCIPSQNTFDAQAKKSISKLCGSLHRDMLLPTVETIADDFSYLFENTRQRPSLMAAARIFYRDLKTKSLRFLQSSTDVRFTREGWHHLNRHSRRKMACIQSWNILGSLPKIIENTSEGSLVRVRRASASRPELVAAKTLVLFPHRQAGVVNAVFRARDSDGERNYSFHTIYEPRRKLNLMGL